jgi:hypothetical protein
VAVCPSQRELQLLDARVWNDDDTGFVGLRSPGVGILHARMVAAGHPVMAGMPERFDIVHYNGPLFDGAEPLSVVEGRSERFTPAEEFLGEAADEPLVDRAAAARVANIVAGEQGDGRVVLFGSHPEFGFGLAMDDEQLPARMLANAIGWQLAASGAPERPAPDTFALRAPVEDALPRVEAAVATLGRRTEALRERGASPVWLDRAQAMSVFGLEPAEIWRCGLDEIDRLADEVGERAPGTAPRVLSFAPPAEWDLDGGYHGVAALLEQADRLLAEAGETWEVELPPAAHAYAHAETSPYHLVAGSYLSALGRVASAALLCRAFPEAA